MFRAIIFFSQGALFSQFQKAVSIKLFPYQYCKLTPWLMSMHSCLKAKLRKRFKLRRENRLPKVT